jgi:hypothetical protein
VATWLKEKHIGPSNIFLNPDTDFPIAKGGHRRLAQIPPNILSNFFRQSGVGVSSEEFNISIHKDTRSFQKPDQLGLARLPRLPK